ncbi:MAG: hypothetical protein PHS80_09435 [Methanothrix sp.]|nr:hypothetical protein [Methanothrix sp.]
MAKKLAYVRLAPFSDLVPGEVRMLVEARQRAIAQGEVAIFPDVTSSHAPERAGLPASQSTFGFSTGLNSTQSAPTTLLPNPSSTLQGTWYRQLTCIPDQASLKVNGCTEIAASIDIVDLCGVKVMKGVRFIPSPEGDGFSPPLYPDVIRDEDLQTMYYLEPNVVGELPVS